MTAVDGKYKQQVNPMFGAVAGIVTENYFRNSGIVDGNNVEGGEIDFAQEEESLQTGDVIKKAKQNTQLGQQIWQEWKREQAQLEGLPSDEYLLTQQPPNGEQLAAIGGLAKEAYALANPDTIDRIEIKDEGGNTQTGYQLKPHAPKALADTYSALSEPFQSHEIPPVNSVSHSGQPQFEAKTRARKTTTATGIKDPGQRIKEASKNFHAMERIEDRGREKVFYSQAVPAILAGYETVSTTIKEETLTNKFRAGKTYTTLTFDLETLASNDADTIQMKAYDVGASRARGLVQEKLNNMQLLEEQIREEQEAERTNEAKLNSLIDQYEEAIQISPASIYRSDVRTLLETLQTSSRYSNQILHGTYATQMLTGRLQLQQNKWNPQGNTRLRYVVGGPNRVRFTPGSNSHTEQNFKEGMVAHFFAKDEGQYLKPHARLRQFGEWQTGQTVGKVSWNEAVAAGKELFEAYNAIPDEALVGAREVLKGLNATSEVKLGEAIAPLKEIPNLPAFSPETTTTLDKLGADELPYMIDYLQMIYQWNEGKPFSSTAEIEVDGITHGLSSNAMALGIESMALRAGAINPDPDRKLSPIEEAVGLEAVAGDVRDAMKAYMIEQAQTLAEGGNYSNADGLIKVAMQAVEDRDNFLKKSPMTLGYGQELNSLKQHVRTTMSTGKRADQITKLLEQNGISQQEGITYLHALLVDSLETALHPRILETSRQLRANNLISTLTDEILYYDNGSGFRSNIAALEDVKEKRKQSRFTVKNEAGEQISSPSVDIYTEEAAGSATRQYQPGGDKIPGGFGHGRSVPTMAQTYDAAMISGLGTGQTHADIEKRVKSAGYKYSIQPVFDAAKADFATVGYVRDAMNREWVKSLKENDYVGQIMGPGGWYDQTMTKFRKDLRELPKDQPIEIAPDNKWRGIYYFLNNAKGAASMYRGSRSRVEEKQVTDKDGKPTSGKKEVEAIYGILKNEYGIVAGNVTQLTPEQILGVVEIVSQSLRVDKRNKDLARDVKRDREELFKKIKQNDVWQVDY